jgi:hypothetical protein
VKNLKNNPLIPVPESSAEVIMPKIVLPIVARLIQQQELAARKKLY